MTGVACLANIIFIPGMLFVLVAHLCLQRRAQLSGQESAALRLGGSPSTVTRQCQNSTLVYTNATGEYMQLIPSTVLCEQASESPLSR